MRSYLRADAFRLPRYRPLWVSFGIALVTYLAGSYLVSGVGFTPEAYVNVLSIVGLLLPLVVGLGVVGFVYNQDVRAGAMKVAIGHGVSRNRVVAVKAVELLALTGAGLASLIWRTKA